MEDGGVGLICSKEKYPFHSSSEGARGGDGFLVGTGGGDETKTRERKTDGNGSSINRHHADSR